MRSKKTILLIISVIAGSGPLYSAWSKPLAGTTYYVITNGAFGYAYTTNHPASPCQVPRLGSSSPYCTVQTTGGYTPVDNQPIPSNKVASSSNNGKIYGFFNP